MFTKKLLVQLPLLALGLAMSYPVLANETNASTEVVAKTPADDAKITQTIKELIAESSTLSKLKVEVVTQKGVVSLTGNVDSKSQASSLVESAESVIGVADVDTSKLTVKDSTHPLADTYTTAKIKGLFIREKLFGGKDIAALNISVETKDGIVYLTGVIDNQAQLDNVIEIIKKNVPEVKKVEYKVDKFVNPPQ